MSRDLLAALVAPAPKATPVSEHSLLSDMRALGDTKEGASLVPAAFLGIAVLDAIPTPTDAGFFWGENWLKEKGASLSPIRYWAAQTANYYGWDVLWYTTLFAATTLGGTTFTERAKVGAGVVGTGALAALLWKYTRPPDHPVRSPAHRIHRRTPPPKRPAQRDSQLG